MVPRYVVAFEDDSPEDVINFAVAPIDALTGRIVQRNISVTVVVPGSPEESEELMLPDKPVRNLSGMLVFINLPTHTKYRVSVFAKAAGYFDPDPIEFTPPEPDDPSDPRDRLRLDFLLFPLPDFDFIDEATVISGVVVRGEEKVEGAKISVEVIPPALMRMRNKGTPKVFETRTDVRGAFALALMLPSFFGNGVDRDGTGNRVPVKFRIETKADGKWNLELELERNIVEGRRHVFKKMIDLEDPSSKTIGLLNP
jgi:hypothetical protein